MKDKPIMLVVCIVVALCLSIVTIISQIKKSERCDEHVILEDNTQYDCKAVSSFENGITYIDLCNGDEIRIPTRRIKMVTNIKE